MRTVRKKKASAASTLNRLLFAKIDFVVISICVIAIGFSVFGIWYGTLDYQEGEKEYSALEKYVLLIDEPAAQGNTNVTVTSASLRASGAKISDEQKYYIDWVSLREKNPDILAWIIVPGTVINYPIVQTTDNKVYLNTSFEGTKNACGTIFMNTYNRSDFSDLNTIIYGHNMRNGSMFATINQYKSEEFYKQHDEVWILTPYWERKYHIISAHEATDGTETYAIEFDKNGGYAAHIASQVTQSLYDTGTGYSVDLPIVTLSTCTGRGTLSRMVLICQPTYETPLNPFVENKVSK